MIVNFLQLIGSILFTVGSLYAIDTNSVLCITRNCHYDSALWYLIGCFSFFMGNTLRLLESNQANNQQRKERIANEFGSILFMVGSVVYLIDLKHQGTIIFLTGSCIFSISSLYNYLKFRNKNTLVFLSGTILFIIGDLVPNKNTASAVWLIGSILFCIGSLISIKISSKEDQEQKEQNDQATWPANL